VEAIDIIQALLAGTMTNYRGQHFRLDHARLLDRPERKPDMIIAAGGVKAARLAGKLGNGLIATEARADLVEAYAAAGGVGPRYAEVATLLSKYSRRQKHPCSARRRPSHRCGELCLLGSGSRAGFRFAMRPLDSIVAHHSRVAEGSKRLVFCRRQTIHNRLEPNRTGTLFCS
jgi:Luciferase-like monooxygenase